MNIIYRLEVIGMCSDDSAQVFLVEKIDILKNKEYPHLTYSLADGIMPVYSNELVEKSIKDGNIEYFKRGIDIGGYILMIDDILKYFNK